ncbi:hypothetical protein HHI36_009861 [Cryptolaemus montrouzieri]|uniref:Uncharacterized protein n=1 Tax=Cryptolaemus montrouzieri TaxID=559131 RepID=A0ABD2MH22_9CUCU
MKTQNILKRASEARESIHSIRSKLVENGRVLLNLYLRLSNHIHPSIWNQIEYLANKASEEQHKTKSMKQISKFEKLHKKQISSIKPQPPKTTEIKIVHNLSKIALNDSAISKQDTIGRNYLGSRTNNKETNRV